MNSKWTRIGDKVEITINKKELSMDKYKKITDLGLKVCNKSTTWIIPQSFVIADDLLKVLDAGVEVYSDSGTSTWTRGNYLSDTHSALLINIKELKPKQVTITRADLDKAWKKAREGSCIDLNEIAKELGL